MDIQGISTQDLNTMRGRLQGLIARSHPCYEVLVKKCLNPDYSLSHADTLELEDRNFIVEDTISAEVRSAVLSCSVIFKDRRAFVDTEIYDLVRSINSLEPSNLLALIELCHGRPCSISGDIWLNFRTCGLISRKDQILEPVKVIVLNCTQDQKVVSPLTEKQIEQIRAKNKAI